MKQKVVQITKSYPGQKEAAHYTWVNGRVFFMESPVNFQCTVVWISSFGGLSCVSYHRDWFIIPGSD